MLENLTSKLSTLVKGFLIDARRTGIARAALFLSAVFIYRVVGHDAFMQQLGVAAWKISLVGVAVWLSHRIRMQLFPYVDLSAILGTGRDSTNNNSGLIFLGVTVLTAAIVLAVCSGL